MRRLKMDLSELELAFDSGSEMISYYLDLETGEVISVSEEGRGLLESIYESYYDEQSDTVDWVNAFEKEQIPDLCPINPTRFTRSKSPWMTPTRPSGGAYLCQAIPLC